MSVDRLISPASFTRRQLLRAIGGAGALGGLGLLSACGGGAEVTLEPIATSLLTTTPENQAATYRNVHRLYATRGFAKSAQMRGLSQNAIQLNELNYETASGMQSISDYMKKSRTAGILILKDRKVALERYALGNSEKSLWTSFSVAKSLTSMLIGMAVKEGHIRSLEDPVERYVPGLSASAYSGCSIRSLLRMTSGVAWNEEYATTSGSDIAKLVQGFSSNQPGAVMDLMRSRPRAAPVGSAFNYSTGESYVLGAVLAGAIGGNLSDYLSRTIWGPSGMESDGYWLLDAPGGLEMGGNNFSATLRDYGRLGLFMLEGGADSSRLPVGWRELSGQPDNPITGHGRLFPDYPLGYGYQWWSFPAGEAFGPHGGAFIAQGIYGQFIYVNPQQRVVAVIWSAWQAPRVPELELETYAVLGTAVALLNR